MSDRVPVRFPFQNAFEHFWIDPQTHWERFFNPQFFISLNGGDAPIENHVLGEVGSYGHQLGRIIDVLDVLVARLPADLTPAERTAVDRFRELSRQVDAAVADVRGPARADDVTLSEVERLADGLRSLARTNAAAWRRLSDQLRPALAPDGKDTG